MHSSVELEMSNNQRLGYQSKSEYDQEIPQ